MSTNTTSPKHPLSTRARWLRWNRRNALLLTMVVIAVGAYFLAPKLIGGGDNLDQYQVASVQRGDVEDLVTATGTLQPRDYVDIGAQVSGQLKKIHVEIGSVVSAGDLLAEIDPTVYLANVEARRALLRNQRATLIDREAQLTLAELQYTRQKNLMAGDATTAESLQASEATLRSSKAQLQALQAQIEQTESTLKADEANLNYAKIYAPMAGVIVSISARQGQTLNTNQQAPIILRIADLSTMTVQTQVSEADVSRLSPDMEAYFTTLGNRGKRWYGQLRKVEPTPTVTNNVVLYNALFDVVNTERTLLPQMTAQVFFVAAAAKDALFIPAAALTAKLDGVSPNKGRGKSSDNTPGNQPANSKSSDKTAAAAPFSDKSASEDRAARRARIANMTEAERQVFRAQRAAARDQNGEVAARDAEKTQPAKAQPKVWAGVAPQSRRANKEATIKVVGANGKIEDRTIQIGISNRVHVQVLSGVNEGDQVVVGRKPPPGAESAQTGQGQGQQRERNALQPHGAPTTPGMGGQR